MLSTHFHYVIVIRTLLNTSSEHSHYHHPMGHILLLLLPGVPRYHHLENILWHLQKYLRLFSVLSLCSDRDCKSPLPCSQNKKKKGPTKRLLFFTENLDSKLHWCYWHQKFSPINVDQLSHEFGQKYWNMTSFINELDHCHCEPSKSYLLCNFAQKTRIGVYMDTGAWENINC